MIHFLIKRLIGLLFVVIGITFVTFILGYYAPGDPIAQLLGQHYTRDAYLALKHSYGLDLPWYQQYLNVLIGMLRFDFGLSFQPKGRPVLDMLKDGIPVSLELGFWALIPQVVIGVLLGTRSALKANSQIDTISTSVLLTLYALPSFVFARLVQIAIVWLDKYTGWDWPIAYWGSPWQYSWVDIQHKLVPIFVYAVIGIAYFSRLTRTAILEVMHQDYIRTARAKGLREWEVVYRHALRNALIPLITAIGNAVGFLVTGAFFIEWIFNIPGIAGVTFKAVELRNYPVIQATTVLLAISVGFTNLLADILYTVVNPVIRKEVFEKK